MRFRVSAILILAASSTCADTVLATRVIRPGDIILPSHVALEAVEIPGAYTMLEEVFGQEARVAIYPGRPVNFDSIGPPALVQRNQIVEIRFTRGGLNILTDGRSLSRAGAGERVKIMNIASRSVVIGTVMPDGTVLVK